jgi:hypothetical protein
MDELSGLREPRGGVRIERFIATVNEMFLCDEPARPWPINSQPGSRRSKRNQKRLTVETPNKVLVAGGRGRLGRALSAVGGPRVCVVGREVLDITDADTNRASFA